jgi:hypothetical protein
MLCCTTKEIVFTMLFSLLVLLKLVVTYYHHQFLMEWVVIMLLTAGSWIEPMVKTDMFGLSVQYTNQLSKVASSIYESKL